MNSLCEVYAGFGRLFMFGRVDGDRLRLRQLGLLAAILLCFVLFATLDCSFAPNANIMDAPLPRQALGPIMSPFTEASTPLQTARASEPTCEFRSKSEQTVLDQKAQHPSIQNAIVQSLVFTFCRCTCVWVSCGRTSGWVCCRRCYR